ncbi:MAG: Fe-S cluster assembly protein SufD [Acidimicrobiia bacterium]
MPIKNILDFENVSNSLPGPSWLGDRRNVYFEKLKNISFPTSAEELWRYSDIDNFDLSEYSPLKSDEIGEPGEKKSPGGGVVAAEAGEHSGLVIVRDGRIVHCALDDDLQKQGVILVDIAQAQGEALSQIQKNLGTLAEESSDAFVILTEAMCSGGTYIHVPNNVVVPKPIVVVHWCEGENVAVFDRTFVYAQANSSLNVIERFESSSEKIFLSSITECVVDENASVKYLTTQEDGKNTTHIALHRTHVHRDGRFESSTVSLGGKYARLRGEVALLGPGSNSDVMAVYFGNENQLLDFRTLQDHRSENTTSNLLFKGAVEDTARSVYSGMVHLREVAQRSQAYQTNRNLVLDHGAHAESIPNLMIEANDVKCSHGSTVGPIDEDQMYYLATRGVSPRDAERLIVLGFFEDVFNRLSIPALIDPLRRSVNEKISTLTKKREQVEND